MWESELVRDLLALKWHWHWLDSTLVDASGGFDTCVPVEVSRWSDSAILTGPERSGFDWILALP